MAKKRIGELKGKPIVIGDKNLVSKNEIHNSVLSNSSDDSNYMGTVIAYYIGNSGSDFADRGGEVYDIATGKSIITSGVGYIHKIIDVSDGVYHLHFPLDTVYFMIPDNCLYSENGKDWTTASYPMRLNEIYVKKLIENINN